jgi:peroxiredoxin
LARSKLNRSGLKAGTVAPDFSLPCLSGGEVALTDFRGQRVLLVFSDPNCGPCDELAPLLQELHLARRDLHVLVITRRDAEATSAKAEALGLTYPIVMQQQWRSRSSTGCSPRRSAT